MRPLRVPLLMALLMIAAAIAPYAVRLSPSGKPSAPRFVLDELIPAGFGSWRVAETRGAEVVNPQAQQLLDKLYSQVLTRTYASADGYRIMLSVAYGDEQRGGLQAHMPELCYPAQGFSIHSRSQSAVATADGPLEVRRMEAQMGARFEPVSYWFKLGDQALGGTSSLGRRMVELRFALSGHVPDGLLFRVSSIDDQRDRAFLRQDQFIAELLIAAGPVGRQHLVGTAAR